MSGASQSHMLEWFDLKKRAQLQLKEAEAHQVPSGNWDNLLMRFRKLREGLTAAAAAAELRCEVYLVSADVCAAADNMAELLKCLQQLVNNIYPALEQQQQQSPPQQEQQAGNPAASIQQQQRLHQSQQQDASQQHQQQRQHLSSANSNTNQDSSRFESAWSDTSSNDSDPHGSSSSSDPLRRLPEVAAALLLYFVCVPRQPVIQEITKQLRAASKPRPGSCRHQTSTAAAAAAAAATTAAAAPPASGALICSPLYRQTVLDTAAALRCNWCTFLGSFYGQSHPLLVRAVMNHHVERMRVQAVRKLGVAYRMLPTAVFQRWLYLGCSSGSSSRLGSGSSRGRSVQEPAAGAGVAPAGSILSQASVVCITEVLKKAAESGSKAAGIAAERFVGQGEPSDTMYFRAS